MSNRKSNLLLATGAVLAVASFAVAALPPVGPSRRAPEDFVRGKSNTRAARIVPPKTERQAIAQRRLAMAGIVELELPEDRMVDLVAVKRADGRTVLVHEDETAATRAATVAGGIAE